jgi:hypothetical protein
MRKIAEATVAVCLLVLSSSSCAQINNGVFRIVASSCGRSGGPFAQSAFKPAGSAVLITALHGAAGCSSIQAYDDRGAPAFNNEDLRIDRADIAHDIAELVGSTALPAQGGLSTTNAKPKAFQDLYVYGFPGGRVISRGTRVGVADPPLFMLNSWVLDNQVRDALNHRMSPSPNSVDFIDIDGVLMPGHSGAPLLNASHQVIAVANGGLKGGSDNRSWAVPWSVVTLRPFSTAENNALGHPPDVLFAYDLETNPLPASATQTVAAGTHGAVSINGAGYIPGLRGRLNPILDSSKRSYLYAENVAINGGEPQPVDFTVNTPLQLEDGYGNLFSIAVTSIDAKSAMVSYTKLPDQISFTGPLQVQVIDDAGTALPGAMVAVLFPDGTSVNALSDEKGDVSFDRLKKPIGNIVVTRSHYLATILSAHALHGLLIATLRRSDAAGSLVLKGNMGEIPGLDGYLNPILDAEHRTYIYANNIAINGGKVQPVTFVVNTPMTLEDSHGHRFSLSILAIDNSSSTLEFTRLPAAETAESNAEIAVLDAQGSPVNRADVVVAFSDGTILAGETNSSGIARFENVKKRVFDLFIARPGYGGIAVANQDASNAISVKIYAASSGGSCVIVGRGGQIPGLQGTIQPIFDAENRRYLYATDMEVNDGSHQPVDFSLGKTFKLRDQAGATLNVRVLAMTGYASLIEYTKAGQ